MAKMKFAYPIEEIHGKLKGMFGAAVNPGNNKGTTFFHSVHYGKRKAAVGTDEQANRNLFKIITQKIAARKADSAKRVLDQTGFKAQSTYKTMRAYLWNVCKTEYLAELQAQQNNG